MPWRKNSSAESGDLSLDAIEVVPVLFYRNKGAYLIGWLRIGGTYLPLYALVHGDPESKWTRFSPPRMK
jgi:isocitrate dehydrogenase kinase/phosphatase